MSFLKEIFGFKNLIADVRTTLVSMITVSAVLILAPIITAIWKSVKSQPVPWEFLILITVIGIALLSVALIKFYTLHKAEESVPSDIEQKVRQWTDAFGLTSKPIVDDKLYLFGFRADLPPRIIISITHRKDRPSYLTLNSRIGMSQKQRALFDKMSEKQRASVHRELRLECGRSKISSHWDENMKVVCVHKELPITSDLTEARFRDTIREMIFSDNVVMDTMDKLMPPSLDEKVTRLDVQLRTEGGRIGARVTNLSYSSEERVEDVWLVCADASGKETVLPPKSKLKRCTEVPHVMPARSSFEVTFYHSENSFISQAQAVPKYAQSEYWVEVKLEDGTVIPSEHREITMQAAVGFTGELTTEPRSGAARLRESTFNKTPIELIDEAVADGEKVERFCEGFNPGSECQQRANTWIESTRNILRERAPDYIAMFNDKVQKPFPNPWLPVSGREATETAKWFADKGRYEAWRVVKVTVEQLRIIRSKMRATLPS